MLCLFPFVVLVVESLLHLARGSPIAIPGPYPYRAPLYGATHPDRILKSYIIMFKPNATYTLDQHWQAIGKDLSSSKVRRVNYLFCLPGYTASRIDSSTLDSIRADEHVYLVEADRRFHSRGPHKTRISTSVNLTESITPMLSVPSSEIDVDEDPPFAREEQSKEVSWNLAVLGAGEKLKTPVPNDRLNYYLMRPAGVGVKIYIFDRGVAIHNPAFGGRAVNLWDQPEDQLSPFTDPPQTWADSDGHGTWTAGIAGANTVGIARNSQLVSVKLLNNNGESTLSGELAGYSAAIKRHKEDMDLSESTYRGAVWVIAYGRAPRAPQLPLPESFIKGHESLFKYAEALGITIVAATENEYFNSDYSWPCFHDDVICVGSIDSNYRRPNEGYGPKVEFLAPGEKVKTTRFRPVGPLKAEKFEYQSGTSLAAPHVARVAALYRSWKGPDDETIRRLLRLNSLKGICDNVPNGQPNRLVNSGILLAQDVEEPFRRAGTEPVPKVDCKDDDVSEVDDIVARRLPDEL